MRPSDATVAIVKLRYTKIGTDGRTTLGMTVPRKLVAALGWGLHDRILWRVSETTGNVVMTKIKETST